MPHYSGGARLLLVTALPLKPLLLYEKSLPAKKLLSSKLPQTLMTRKKNSTAT
jgi:hypothetical protein